MVTIRPYFTSPPVSGRQHIGGGYGRIDFLAQDLLGTGDGQFGNALAQLLFGTFTSCSISALAPATTLSASTLAAPLASSTICCAFLRFQRRDPRISPWLHAALRRNAWRRAPRCSCLPRSAAARPSAICFCRSPSPLQRRPNVLHRDPDEDRKPDRLANQVALMFTPTS